MNSETQNEPYYAVIFTSVKNSDDSGYEEMAHRMVDLAQQQNGFLGIESVRDLKGIGITVSYWQTLQNITDWKKNLEHQAAQKLGKEKWYDSFKVRICKVEREYSS